MIYLSESGNNNWSGMEIGEEWKDFTKVCNSSSPSKSLTLSSGRYPLSNAACDLSYLINVTCASGDCIIDFTNQGSIIMNTHQEVDISNWMDIIFSSEQNGPYSLFQVTETSLSIKNSQFTSLRPLLDLNRANFTSEDTYFQIQEDDILFWPNGAITAQKSVISLRNSNFHDSTAFSPLISITSSSELNMDDSSFDQIQMTVQGKTTATPMLISSKSSSSIVLNSISASHIWIHADRTLPTPLIHVDDGVVEINDSQFFDNVGSILASSSPMIRISQSHYDIHATNFTSNLASGCTDLHISGSNGSISNCIFDSSMISGEPNPSGYDQYAFPPHVSPTTGGQATVCVTRGEFSSLSTDFGAERHSPSLPGGGNAFSSNTWRNITVLGTTWDEAGLRRFGFLIPPFQLYATDLWASNVHLELLLNSHTHGEDLTLGSIRVDGCSVALLGSSTLAGWIDFGSYVEAIAMNVLLKSTTFAIYGQGPGFVSEYSFNQGGIIRILSVGVSAPSPVFTSLRMNGNSLGAHFTMQSSTTDKEVWFYGTQHLIPFPDYSDELNFTNILVELHAPVVYARTTAPWVFNPRVEGEAAQTLFLQHSFMVPQPASPWSAMRGSVATIQANVTLKDYTLLYVADLVIDGNLYVEASASSINFITTPTTLRGLTHGLNVTGTFIFGDATEHSVQLAPHWRDFVDFEESSMALPPVSSNRPGTLSGWLSVEGGMDVSLNVLGDGAMEWYREVNGDIPFGTQNTSWELKAIIPTVTMHPSGTSYIISFEHEVRSWLILEKEGCLGFVHDSPIPDPEKECDWIDDRTIRLRKDGLAPSGPSLQVESQFTSQGMSNQISLPRRQLSSTEEPDPSSRWVPTLAVQQMPRMADLTPGAKLRIDASLSFHTPNTWVNPVWTLAFPNLGFSDLRSFLTANEGEWVLEVPFHILQEAGNYNQYYTFAVTLKLEDMVEWYVPSVTAMPYTFAIQIIDPSTIPGDYCNSKAEIILDTPIILEYYAGQPIQVNAYWDPQCEAVASGETTFVWILTASGNPTPIMHSTTYSGSMIFSFIQPTPVPFTLTVNATSVTYGFWSSTTVNLHYQPYKSIIWPDSHGIIEIGGDAQLKVQISDITDYDSVSVVWEGQSCPNDAFELYPHFMPFPDATNPIPSHPCWTSSEPPVSGPLETPSHYDFAIINDSTSANFYPLLKWQEGVHTAVAQVLVKKQGIEYRERVEFPVEVVSSLNQRVKVKIELLSPFSRPYLSNLPNRQVTFRAVVDGGVACGDCHYSWTIDGVEMCSGPNPRCAYSPQIGGAELLVELYLQHYTTYPSNFDTGKASMKLKIGEIPISNSEIQDSILPDFSMRLASQGWVSEYPNLKYFYTTKDCDSNVEIPLAMPQFSPILHSIVFPTYRCENNSQVPLNVYVQDALGATNRKTAMVAVPRPQPLLFENMLKMAQFFNKFKAVSTNPSPHSLPMWHQLMGFFHPDTIINETAWTNYKSTASDLIAQSLIKMSSQYLGPNGVLFIRMIAQPTILDRLRSRSLSEAISIATSRSLQVFQGDFSTFASGLHRSQFRASVLTLDALFETYFGPAHAAPERPSNMTGWTSGTINALKNFRLIFDLALPSLTDAISPIEGSVLDYVLEPWIERRRSDWVSERADITVTLTTGNFESQASVADNAIYVNMLVFRDGSFPLLPTSTTLAPIRNVVSLIVANRAYQSDGVASFRFTNVSAAHAATLECVTWLSNSLTTQMSSAEIGRCIKTRPVSEAVDCACSFPGSSFIHVGLMMPNALCSGSPPTGEFTCLNGIWTSAGSITTPTITIGSPTTITGDLNVETITFGGLSVTLNVTGCATLGSIEITISLEEYETLLASGDEITILLLTANTCDIKGLDQVPISLNTQSGTSSKCEKITVQGQTTSSTLSAVFSIDKSGCKKSSKWWIILVSVLGAVILLAIIIALLATFTPLKDIIRPHAKRAKESNTYCMDKTH